MLLQSKICINKKNKKYSNFLHAYCDADRARDISDRRSVNSIFYPFNGNIIYYCSKKHSETSESISNSETRAINKGVLDQNRIRDFFR